MRHLSFILTLLLAAGLGLAQATTQPTAERVPHPEPKAGEVRELTIKELGNFEYDDITGGNIPEDVKRLSGSTIRLVGYMRPLDQADNITVFELVPSLADCCFGQPPQIQHTITVRVPSGYRVKYSSEEIVCEGVLKVEEKREDDWILSVFEFDLSRIRLAAR